MRAMFALILVIGVALAGGAVYMAQGYIGQTEARMAQATEFQRKLGRMVPVFAAARAMPFGTALTQGDVRVTYVQQNALPPGVFLAEAAEPADQLFPDGEDKPRLTTRSVLENEILVVSRVTEPGKPASLTGKLDKGMRAFQIKVDLGVRTFIMPDMLIDIYWTGTPTGKVAGQITQLIESGVRVIAVDNISGEVQTRQGNASTVTVAVTPEQVARLAQAQASGRLTMSLIASAEDVVTEQLEIDRDKLLGIVRPEVVAADTPEVCSIKTRKGGSLSEVVIPCAD